MVKLTVIIPGYNTRREWWVRCVRSVSASLVKACGGAGEILCIDDGSLQPVNESWFEGIPSVKIIRHEKNAGLPTARNTGLDAASGEYVTFVDSDDEVKETCFENCLKALEKYQADVAVYGVKGIYLADRLTCTDVLPEKYYGALKPEDVKSLYRARLFYYSCNKVFRRSFFEDHHMRFDPLGVPAEDAIFNVGLVMAQAKWVTVNDVGYVYYRYDGTICSNYKPTYVQGTRACTKRWREYKATIPNAYEIFGDYDETSEEDIVRNQWTNIWRRNSPFTVRERWRYAKEHHVVLGNPTFWVFFKKAIFMWFRVHFYIKPIRIFHQVRVNARRGVKFDRWDGIV